MDEAAPRSDSQKAYRAGPDAAGATSESLLQGDPGGARRRPLLRFLDSSWTGRLPMPVVTPGPGTDGNHSCGLRSDGGGGRGLRRHLLGVRPRRRLRYSWTTRPSMPPATVTIWPVTCAVSRGEARTTTWAATSSDRAT